MKEEPSALQWPHHPSGDVTCECVCAGVWKFSLVSGRAVRPLGIRRGNMGCQVEGWCFSAVLCPKPFCVIASMLVSLPLVWKYCGRKHVSKRDSTHVRQEPETSRNMAGKERKIRKIVEETFRGPECQRYHYLSISLNETHLAGLVSHSQWDPEVMGASDED